MEETSKIKALKVFLKIFGVISLALFGTLIVLTASDAPIIQEGGALRFLRWDMFAKHVELMLETVYFVWGVFLLLASRKPLAYISFLQFTLWANLVHGLLMVVQAFVLQGFMYKMFLDVAYCLILSIGIWYLLPKTEESRTA